MTDRTRDAFSHRRRVTLLLAALFLGTNLAVLVAILPAFVDRLHDTLNIVTFPAPAR